MNPTDEELIAAWNEAFPDATSQVDPWLADSLRYCAERPTRDEMEEWVASFRLCDEMDTGRLADVICRRFPLRITDSVLAECGFDFVGDMAGVGLFDLRGTDGKVDAYWDESEGGVRVAWGEDSLKCGREFVTDARRLRKLVEGLELVYGPRKETT